jgi:hypothetical protein
MLYRITSLSRNILNMKIENIDDKINLIDFLRYNICKTHYNGYVKLLSVRKENNNFKFVYNVRTTQQVYHCFTQKQIFDEITELKTNDNKRCRIWGDKKDFEKKDRVLDKYKDFSNIMKEINLDNIYCKPEYILSYIRGAFLADDINKITKIKQKIEKEVKKSPYFSLWKKIDEMFDELVKECQINMLIKKAESCSEEQFIIRNELTKLGVKNFNYYLPMTSYTELDISCYNQIMKENIKFSDSSSQEVFSAMRLLVDPFL